MRRTDRPAAELRTPRLPFPRGRLEIEDWQRLLAPVLGNHVAVAYGRSRTAPVRLQHRHDGAGPARAKLHLHEAFGAAPPQIQDALLAWLRSGRRARRACALLDHWLERQLEALPPPVPAKTSLRPRGAHHDLALLAEALWSEEFAADFGDARPRPAITWGRRGRRRCRHSLQLGSYDPERHLIRVHPVLDRADVPAWYLRAVLFHEILHAALPPRRNANGRMQRHGPAFRGREQAFTDHERARVFEKKNLARLIRAARRGTG